tara:strand:+ start:1373 stop:1903 length:531 start_codon:yes stop_codon:yes gene_type:complete
MKDISLILACTFDGGIGYNNKIPWYIKSDLIKFKNITVSTNNPLKYNAVIMGKNTYFSLPNNKLSNRINIVISNNLQSNKDILCFSNIDDAINYCNKEVYIEKIFIIGGSKLYNYFIDNNNLVSNIYLTLLKNMYKCDTFINIKNIFNKFKFIKDIDNNINNNEYISYICINKILQ